MSRIVILLSASPFIPSIRYSDSTSMIELERVIDKKVAFFHRAPCNVSQGLLVHIDTRCRVPVPLIDADRQRGVLQKVAVNFKLVCRKPVGDIVVNYAHTYEEQPYDVWSSLIVNEQERKLLMENCH